MSKGKGIPVYLDKIKRKFADSALEQMEVTDWHPSNNPSMHLWRCFEALKDIANLLNKGIFGLAQTYEIGTWLHQCIITLSKVLSFEVFAWTTDDCPEGYVRFMTVEPWLVTFKLENDRPVALAGLHLTESPLKLIVKTCEEIILSSQWMFRPEDPRIISLQEGSTDKKKPV